jgi:hypothetical protein
MSSVKRRKVDTSPPSTLPKSKKNVAEEESPHGNSPESSSESVTKEAEKSAPAQEEVVKSFKDLVWSSDQSLAGTSINAWCRVLSIRYVTLAQHWDTRLQLQFNPSQFRLRFKEEI